MPNDRTVKIAATNGPGSLTLAGPRLSLEAMLADEPTGNLDSENSDLILDLIIRLRREQNFTLVLVTHDMGIARKAGRVISMKDGRIVSDELNEISHPKMT
jgi:ABC-type lipoprotein export system ATPase subunit